MRRVTVKNAHLNGIKCYCIFSLLVRVNFIRSLFVIFLRSCTEFHERRRHGTHFNSEMHNKNLNTIWNNAFSNTYIYVLGMINTGENESRKPQPQQI